MLPRCVVVCLAATAFATTAMLPGVASAGFAGGELAATGDLELAALC